MMNKVSSEQIELIETDLAEQAILKYEQNKRQIKHSRDKFLNNKKTLQVKQFHKQEVEKVKKERFEQIREEHKVTTGRFKTILRGLEKGVI
jgi:exopolyphosphatase/pppGpp-phosphohydrolase